MNSEPPLPLCSGISARRAAHGLFVTPVKGSVISKCNPNTGPIKAALLSPLITLFNQSQGPPSAHHPIQVSTPTIFDANSNFIRFIP